MKLLINKRPFDLSVVGGKPHINGMPTKKFIARCKREKDDIAIKHLLAVAAQVVHGGRR